MKKMTALLLAALMVLSMAACASKPAETAESDLAYIQDKGTLVVGITDFAPMDYQNESGEWVGFDADLAKAFAESLGVKVEFVEIVWDNKVLELDSKTIDCVWNGMTLTSEVTSAMACSNAYCNNAQVVIVPADKAADYQTVESVKDLTFAAEAGSAGEACLLYTSPSPRPDGGRRRYVRRRRHRLPHGCRHGRRRHGLREPHLHLRPELRRVRRRLPQGFRPCPEAE